jgi:O-antigen/teichoic acid export membrane protein
MRDSRDPPADCAIAGNDGLERLGRGQLGRRRGTAIRDWRSHIHRVRGALGVHFALTLNAGTLALATTASGALGFVFWWVAARFFTPTNVGIASADIALMMLLSVAADVGFGTLLLGEIPRRQSLAPHLVSAALLASCASAGVFVLGYLASTAAFGYDFGVRSTGLLLFLGVGVQTASTVLDAALVGMLQAPLRLFRNLVFCIGKLLLVVGAAAVAIPDNWQANAIIASWVIGQALAAASLAVICWSRGWRIWYGPRFDLLLRLVGVAFWHYVLNFAAMAPGLILPLIIAWQVSPEENAPFYAAWMLLSLASTVPTALSTVLFSVGSSGSSSADSSIRFSLFTSLAAGLVAAVGFGLLSNIFLNILNPAYVHLVGSDLRFLGVSVPLIAVKVHYMTVQRLEGRLRQAAVALWVLGGVEVLFAGLGAEFHGLLGVTVGWPLAMGLEALCLWPTIWRRLRRDRAWPSTGTVAAVPAASELTGPPRDAMTAAGQGQPTPRMRGIGYAPYGRKRIQFVEGSLDESQ